MLYRNPCYSEGCYNEVDLYRTSLFFIHSIASLVSLILFACLNVILIVFCFVFKSIYDVSSIIRITVCLYKCVTKRVVSS